MKTRKEVADNDLQCLHFHASDALDHMVLCKKLRKLMGGKQSHSDDESRDRGMCIFD